MKELKLGYTLRDATSGFQGIAIHKTEFLNGNIQYSLQPMCETGAVTLPESVSIDYHMLDYVDSGVSERVVESTYTSPIKLGDKVKDVISGHTGIATMKTNYLNGCAGYYVAGEISHTDGKTICDWFDQTRLTIIGKPVVTEKPSADKNGKSPGGPVMRSIPRSAF